MIIRAKAPLRLGLAGGGTDVSPYSENYGGAVLNVTIDKYAYCIIEPTGKGEIEFISPDMKDYFISKSLKKIQLNGNLLLHKGVYNRIVKDYNNGEPLSFKMTTYSDAPAGSGLGTSSTMVVAIIKAFSEWLKLPLGEYDIAFLAYLIERKDLKLAGGKQDQFAAAFGGFNFMEFYENDRVIVNPLRIKNWIKNELEASFILYYTGKSRKSSNIIKNQIKNTEKKIESSISATHELKKYAIEMKNSLLKGEFDNVAKCLNESWKAKKRISKSISNKEIDNIYDFILNNGGKAGKVSGAGGGGFIMALCDPKERYHLMTELNKSKGKVYMPKISEKGAEAWTLFEKGEI
jgi:D-glycero-alpha-D-manno-heptose-7-phosphate kinase